jgi:hypothetical protein
MEALSATVPLVLVLRGGIIGAIASASAPGPLPHPRAPAQIKIEKADARAEIVRSVIVDSRLLMASRSQEVVINGCRVFVKRRLDAELRGGSWQLIVDLP